MCNENRLEFAERVAYAIVEAMSKADGVHTEEQARLLLVGVIRQHLSEEILQRLRRIETKLHKIAPDAVTTMTLEAGISNGKPVVWVPGYDTTLAEIRRAGHAGQLDPGAIWHLVQVPGDVLLGTMRLTNRQ